MTIGVIRQWIRSFCCVIGRNMSKIIDYYQLDPEEYQQALARIYQALEIRTQMELARVLNIRQSSVSDSKRRQHLPEKWLLRLVMGYNLNPGWVLQGKGAKHLAPSDMGPPDIETLLNEAKTSDLLRAVAVRMNRPDLIVVQKENVQWGTGLSIEYT